MQTEDNLKDAFAGESQAHMKYLNFAAKAQQEDKPNVARLFQAASLSEQIHASAHLSVLKGIGATAENLAAAIGGESFEVAEMYPGYAATAEKENAKDALQSINRALAAEKVHKALYTRAKEAVVSGKDVAVGTIWVCPNCGFTMEGERLDKCPECGWYGTDFKGF